MKSKKPEKVKPTKEEKEMSGKAEKVLTKASEDLKKLGYKDMILMASRDIEKGASIVGVLKGVILKQARLIDFTLDENPMLIDAMDAIMRNEDS